jgi:hypothetical protein
MVIITYLLMIPITEPIETSAGPAKNKFRQKYATSKFGNLWKYSEDPVLY